MSGGKSYTLKTTTPFSDKSKKVQLCLYVVTTQDKTNRKSTLKLGLYVKADYTIGPWGDYGGSYLYSTNNTFDGDIPSFSGTRWLVSNISASVTHDAYGDASIKIPWKWGVQSTWGNFYNASGSKTVKLANIGTKKYTITYNANGGSGAPSSGKKTHGETFYLSSKVPTRSGYTFTGWNTKANGTGTAYASGGAYKKNAALTVYAQWSKTVTKCTSPSSLTVTDLANNTVELSCVSGSSGTGNAVSGVEFLITFDGTIPSISNYHCRKLVSCDAKSTAKVSLSFEKNSRTGIEKLLGADCKGDIKFIARTRGAAGASYYSDYTTTTGSGSFIWYGGYSSLPIFITPNAAESKKDFNNTGFSVSWTPATPNINDSVLKYELKVYNPADSMDDAIHTYDVYPANSNGNFLMSYYINFTDTDADNNFIIKPYDTYIFSVKTITHRTDIPEVYSTPITIEPINKLSSPVIRVSEGLTVPSVTLGSRTTYINTGTGDVLKLSWDILEPELTNFYTLDISYFDKSGTSHALAYSIDIGKVNEYCLSAELLNSVPLDSYELAIKLTARSIYGFVYNSVSDTVYLNIKNGCGIYAKVSGGNDQPLMKRAAALARVSDQSEDAGLLLSSDSFELVASDTQYLAVDVQVWSIMSDFYKRNSNDTWDLSDITYEVLLDSNNEPITISTGELIYIK